MAVKLAAPIVLGEPSRKVSGPGLGVTRLVVAVGEGVRALGIPRVEEQGALDLGDAGGNVASLDARPAEKGQELPILPPMRREALQHRQLGLAVVAASAEAEQAEHSQRQRQRHRVARIFGQVFIEERQGCGPAPSTARAMISTWRASRGVSRSRSARAAAASARASGMRRYSWSSRALATRARAKSGSA